MSDTPRTDAEVHRPAGGAGGFSVIDTNFARQLERELNKAIAQRDAAIGIAESLLEAGKPIGEGAEARWENASYDLEKLVEQLEKTP